MCRRHRQLHNCKSLYRAYPGNDEDVQRSHLELRETILILRASGNTLTCYPQVPPKDNIDRVPLGASSASMYPGYSPADHIYGEAAQEYGQYAAERKRQGIELEADPNGPQYEVGQSRRAGQSQGASEEPDVSHAEISDPKEQAVQNDETLGEPMEGVLQSDNASQYFVIDTKPTPREELPNFISQSAPRKSKDKRRVSFVEEENIPDKNGDSRERKRKRSKITNQEDNTVALQSRQPAEDLSTEVEARLQAKEEKKKRREEKKRSRDSSDTTVGVDANGTVSVESIGKVKKAKHKHDRSNTEGGNEATLEFHQDAKREKRKKKRPGVESSTA